MAVAESFILLLNIACKFLFRKQFICYLFWRQIFVAMKFGINRLCHTNKITVDWRKSAEVASLSMKIF